MIEPLRYNLENAPALVITKPVFCGYCLSQRAKRNNPQVAIKFCTDCVDKSKKFFCLECDETYHREGAQKLHSRRILVIGPGIRKKVIKRGDAVNFPLPMDYVRVRMKARIYHDGKLIHNDAMSIFKYTAGNSGKTVHVQVLGGKSFIAAGDGGTSSPYIVASYCGKKLGVTRVRPRTLDPRWINETFIVPLTNFGKGRGEYPEPRNMPGSQKGLFRLEAYNQNTFGAHSFLGHTELPKERLLKLAIASKSQPILLPLSTREFHGILGIELGINAYHVTVRVAKAEGLDRSNPLGGSNPYVKTYFGDIYLGRTKIEWDTCDPKWTSVNTFRLKINEVMKRERELLKKRQANEEALQRQFERQQELRRSMKMSAVSTSARPPPTESIKSADDLVPDVGQDAYVLFRFELYDFNLFRPHGHLGTSRVQVDDLRKLCPTLPRRLVEERVPTLQDELDEATRAANNRQGGFFSIFTSCCRAKKIDEEDEEADDDFWERQFPEDSLVDDDSDPLMRQLAQRGSASDSPSQEVKVQLSHELTASNLRKTGSMRSIDLVGSNDANEEEEGKEESPTPVMSHAPSLELLISSTNPPAAVMEQDQQQLSRIEEDKLDLMPIAPAEEHQQPRLNQLEAGAAAVAAATTIEALTASSSPRPSQTSSLTIAPAVASEGSLLEPSSAFGNEQLSVVNEQQQLHSSRSSNHSSNGMANDHMLQIMYGNDGQGGDEDEPTIVRNDEDLQNLVIGSRFDDDNEGQDEDEANDDDEAHDDASDSPLIKNEPEKEWEKKQREEEEEEQNNMLLLSSSSPNAQQKNTTASSPSFFSSLFFSPKKSQVGAFEGIDLGLLNRSLSSGEPQSKPYDPEEIIWGKVRHFMVEQESTKNVADAGDSGRDATDRGHFIVRLIPATRGNVIQGLDEGVRTMSLGETSTLKIRYDHAYNNYCMGGNIPARSNIIFTVQLLGINEKGPLGMPWRVMKRCFRTTTWTCRKTYWQMVLCHRDAVAKKRCTRLCTYLYDWLCVKKIKAKDEEVELTNLEEESEDEAEDDAILSTIKVDSRMKKVITPSVLAGSRYLWNFDPSKRPPPIQKKKKKKNDKQQQQLELEPIVEEGKDAGSITSSPSAHAAGGAADSPNQRLLQPNSPRSDLSGSVGFAPSLGDISPPKTSAFAIKAAGGGPPAAEPTKQSRKAPRPGPPPL